MTRCTHTLLTIILILFAAGWSACSGTEEDPDNTSDTQDMGTTNTPQDQGSGQGGTVNCQSRCEAKAVECGAPAQQATLSCSMDFCSGQPTEAYVSCLEGVGCPDIADPNEIRTRCGGGSTNSGECTCTPVASAADGTFKSCEGSSVTCMTGELCISEQKSGNGTCEVPCSSSEEGTQGSCPSGQTCNKFKESVPGSGMFFHTCQ